MAVEAYLGNPPQRIIDWIRNHSQPAGHPETRFTLQGGTVETYDIVGDLTIQWMIDNKFFDPELYDDEDPSAMWMKKIVSVQIGTDVTNLKAVQLTIAGESDLIGPFIACSSLDNIAISDSVMNIDTQTFSDCEGLTSMIIPNSVTSIGSYAFAGCNGLTNVTISDSATSIGEGAFYGCRGLVGVLTIPDSVTNIGDSAFFGCDSLTSVTIPNSVTNIGSYAFCGCNGLTSVTIPDGVTNIGRETFSYCSGLTSVTIPDSVMSIDSEAFYDCSGLTSVTIIATGKPGANAANVKEAMINAGVSSSITWNMPK